MKSFEKIPSNEEEWQLLTELRSLGLKVDKVNELNNKQELENLVENLKQTLYQEYKTDFERQ